MGRIEATSFVQSDVELIHCYSTFDFESWHYNNSNNNTVLSTVYIMYHVNE